MAEPAPPITHRRILYIALPIVLANATVPILGAVDTAVVGQAGLAAPIGGVGIGALILVSIYWMFGFLRMGTTGLTSQAIGAGRMGEVSALFSRAMMIGLGAGVMVIALQAPLFLGAFWLADPSDEVRALAGEYTAIRVWSAPATIALYGINGWLIARERTRRVLVLQLWMNGANIVLDLLFVLQFGWGVRGVAFATFLAEWSGLALGLWLCRDVFANAAWRAVERVFDRAALTHMARVNGDILIRSAFLQTIFVSFLFIPARFGDVPLAANQILLHFLEITAYALDGFAFAAEALVGQALGARAPGALRRGALLTSLWGLYCVIALALAFALFGGPIIDVMTTAPEVRAEARIYLPYMVAAPLIGLASWMLDGVFIGATRTRDMRNMMALSFLVYVAAVAVLVPWLGNHGLWLALLISFIARGATLGWKYPGLEATARA